MEGNCEPVSGGPSPHGKWELLSTSDGEKKKERTKTLEKEKSFEQRLTERMNAALDESIGDDKMKSPSRTRSARRQNATLEDFMSPGRKTSRSNQPKRNRNDLVCASPIVSPPHKSHRLFSPKRGNENRSTSRYVVSIQGTYNSPLFSDQETNTFSLPPSLPLSRLKGSSRNSARNWTSQSKT